MHSKLIALTAFVLALFVLPIRTSQAWHDTGHRMVALVAWEDLTPETRTAVTEVLKHHPRYEKDLIPGSHEGATADDVARDAFSAAAVWPDLVRSKAHPMNVASNHPQWHYINIPFEDGVKAPPAREPKDPGPRDILEALAQCTAELKDPAITADKKAVALCWIAHLVGDIHQPLHAATHYSAQFPDGDAGGNYASVLRDPPYPDTKANLHSVWDSLPGEFHSDFIRHYLVTGLRSDPEYSREHFKPSLGKADFPAWAKESHALAVEHAYLNGKLEVAVEHRSAPSREPTPGLPPGYLKDAEPVAMRQVALAGYRLADLLNAMLDEKK